MGVVRPIGPRAGLLAACLALLAASALAANTLLGLQADSRSSSGLFRLRARVGAALGPVSTSTPGSFSATTNSVIAPPKAAAVYPTVPPCPPGAAATPPWQLSKEAQEILADIRQIKNGKSAKVNPDMLQDVNEVAAIIRPLDCPASNMLLEGATINGDAVLSVIIKIRGLVTKQQEDAKKAAEAAAAAAAQDAKKQAQAAAAAGKQAAPAAPSQSPATPAPAPGPAPPASTTPPASGDEKGSSSPETGGNTPMASVLLGGMQNSKLCKDAEAQGGSAGALTLTLEQLLGCMVTQNRAKAQEYLTELNKAMACGRINTCQRVAAFMSQVGLESGDFRYFEELASGQAYEGRAGLGNTQPGDGPRFKGRGPIQLTGRANYRAAGKALGMDLENNPTIVATKEVGFLTTTWYWISRKINAAADAGDIVKVSKLVNGGTNGLEGRKQRYGKCKAKLGC